MADQDTRVWTPALPLRLKEYRSRTGLSVQALAERLETPAYTVRRWETGSSRPSRAQADRLSDIGFGPVSDAETNLGSRSRIKVNGSAASASDDRAFDLELPGYPHAKAPPWVLNGPPDQHGFQKRLVKLQVERDGSVPPQHLSMVAEYEPGARTAQNALESPKATAASWNSNYGSHGWHRYVGRFPPHVVRALLNHFGANSHSLVCDPFSGSGTTAVECRLLGIPFVGIEIGALSHLMASVKAGFSTEPGELVRLSQEYEIFYREGVERFKSAHGAEYDVAAVLNRSGNCVPTFTNIEKWFTPEAFLGVSLTVEFARSVHGHLSDAVLLALSAKMRSIGNVDVDVVRAEYSKKPRQNVDVGKLVTARLRKMNADIASMVKTHPDMGPASSIRLIEGSTLAVDIPEGSLDCIITSPPYGIEALSYLRTHLLSYRSLASELDHDPYVTRDQTIGSEYLEEASLPKELSVAAVSQTFREFFYEGSDGDLDKKTRQRRAAMMQFFEDMHILGGKMSRWLKDGGGIAFVIGNKRLGDRVIPTDEIIRESFAASGLCCYDELRHKLKTNNSNSQVPWQERIIQEEAILLFERTPRA